MLKFEIDIEPAKCPADWMIGPKSFFVDRATPDFEHIRLSSMPVAGGRIEVTADPDNKTMMPFTPCRRKHALERKIFPGRYKTIEIDGFAIDYRFGSPQNWAHILTGHLPLLLKIRSLSDKFREKPITVILPQDSGAHIIGVCELAGFKAIASDAPVNAHVIQLSTQLLALTRDPRRQWIIEETSEEFWPTIYKRSKLDRAYDKIFLVRKEARKLSNEAELEEYLSGRGYLKVYAEDYSFEDQFRLLADATDIIATHGAALGPLIYRPPSTPRFRLIELFPIGHIASLFRYSTHQMNGEWLCVRGKLKPEHIEPGYALDKPFVEYSQQEFEIDVESLKYAMDGRLPSLE